MHFGRDCHCFNKTRRVEPVDEFIALCDSNTEYWCSTVLVYTTDNGYMYHWTPCVNEAGTRHNKTGPTTSTIGSQLYRSYTQIELHVLLLHENCWMITLQAGIFYIHFKDSIVLLHWFTTIQLWLTRESNTALFIYTITALLSTLA